MGDEPSDSRREDEPTTSIEPGSEDVGGETAAPEPPRRRSLLPRRRQAGGREDRARAATPERPKKSLFPRRRSARDTPEGSPDEAPTGEVPAEAASAPVEEGDRPRRRSARPPKAKRRRRQDRPTPVSALRRERRALLASRQDAAYHLGGLAFELYRRDLLDDGILRQRAAELAAFDDRIRAIDRQLGDRAARRRPPAAPVSAQAAGSCLVCRADFAMGARFCSNCGARLAPEALDSEQVTRAIDIPAES